MPSIIQKAATWLVSKSRQGDFNKILGTGVTGANKLDKPYRESVWIMRAIKTVATPIASVPLSITEADGDTPVEDPALAAFWRKPFLGMSYFDGIEATAGWLKLCGEAFWVADDEWLLPFPDVSSFSPLMIARPDRMRAIVEAGEVVAWEYRNESGRVQLFLPEQVYQHKFWNPYDSIKGMAELAPASTAAESDYLAGQMKRNLMRSNGDRGVYVIAANGQPDDAQRKQIVEELRAKQHANQRGEARVTFLAGDFKIEDPKIQVPDAAFHAGRLHDRHEIYIAFGVPASMADIQSSYSIGSASDRFRLIEDTCMPLGSKIAEGMEHFARRQIQREVQIALDWDEHSTMQAVRAERIESADRLAQRGMPMREISEYLRLGLPRYRGDDIGYIPMTLQPVGSEFAPEADPSLEERHVTSRPQTKAVDDMLVALSTPITREDDDSTDEGEQFQKSRPASERRLWRAQMAARNASVKRFERSFKRVLFDARKETLKKIEEKGGSLKAVNKAAATDFIFDLEVFRTAFFGAMRKAAQTAFMAGGSQVLDEIGIDDPFESPPEKVLLFLRQRENLLRDIPDAVHTQIMDTLQEGIASGESTAKLAGRVRAEFNGIDAARARTIAQTETAAAYGSGRQASMEQSGIQYKKWLTSGNANVRGSHRAANGQVVRVDQDFTVGDAQLAHPADHSGPPEETINCHCVSIAVANAED